MTNFIGRKNESFWAYALIGQNKYSIFLPFWIYQENFGFTKKQTQVFFCFYFLEHFFVKSAKERNLIFSDFFFVQNRHSLKIYFWLFFWKMHFYEKTFTVIFLKKQIFFFWNFYFFFNILTTKFTPFWFFNSQQVDCEIRFLTKKLYFPTT